MIRLAVLWMIDRNLEGHASCAASRSVVCTVSEGFRASLTACHSHVCSNAAKAEVQVTQCLLNAPQLSLGCTIKPSGTGAYHTARASPLVCEGIVTVPFLTQL